MSLRKCCPSHSKPTGTTTNEKNGSASWGFSLSPKQRSPSHRFTTSIFVVMRPKNEGKNHWNDQPGHPQSRKEKGDEKRDKNWTRDEILTNKTSR